MHWKCEWLVPLSFAIVARHFHKGLRNTPIHILLCNLLILSKNLRSRFA